MVDAPENFPPSPVPGGTTFAPLGGLPVVPISTMNLKPNDPNLLVVATYGRSVWTYTFTQTLPGGGGGGVGVEPPGTRWESRSPGRSASSSPQRGGRRRSPATRSTRGSALLRATPRPELPAHAVLRRVDCDAHLAGCGSAGRLDVRRLPDKRDTEPGFDFLTVQYSTDGTIWTTAKWIWDTETSTWSDQLSFDGLNAGYPAFDLEKVAFKAPPGPLQVRFRFSADQLISSPLYTGVHVDDVAIGR